MNKYFETNLDYNNSEIISTRYVRNTELNQETKSYIKKTSPKKQNPNEIITESNPLLNINTSLESLRISHSTEKSKNDALINGINGINTLQNKPFIENESNIYNDMYEILNKENNINNLNLANKGKIKSIKKLNNKKIKTKNSLIKLNNYNKIKCCKLVNENKNKKINIDKIFKEKFEEISKNPNTLTHKTFAYKYVNISNPNYFEDSLSKENTLDENNYENNENSERGIVNLTYVPLHKIKMNSNEYINSLLNEEDSEEKRVQVSELDINIEPSNKKSTSAKKPKINKNLLNVPDIKKYLFSKKFQKNNNNNNSIKIKKKN